MDDNQAIPDDLDDLERKYLARGAFDNPDSDDENAFELDSNFSVDEELQHLEEEEIFDKANGVVIEDDSDWSKVLSSHRPKGNTGGKGVLADYEEARRITKRRNETKALKQREAWKRQGYGAKGVSSLTQQQQKPHESDDEESEDEEELMLLQKLKASRLQQLSMTSGLPQFGELISVGKYQFVDEVDHADKRTFVVTHLYEDYLSACERMNNILSVLAARYPHVKFLKLKVTEADPSLSHSVLPAFLVYKGGNLVGRASINTDLTEFKNDRFTEDDVEWLLVTKYGVNLPGVDVNEQERRRRHLETEEEDDIRGSVVVDASKTFRRIQ
jgi:hypothetical protein